MEKIKCLICEHMLFRFEKGQPIEPQGYGEIKCPRCGRIMKFENYGDRVSLTWLE